MPFPIGLSLLLIAASPQTGASSDPAEAFCGEAMGLHLPEPQGTPAPNIALENFQTMSPDDRCVRNVEHDELMRLHAGIKPIAAAAFADSPSAFGVMVRYTLTPDTPATFDMRTSDTTEADRQRLTLFHERAAALTDFHSTSGTVYVVFRYAIAPAQGSAPAVAR